MQDLSYYVLEVLAAEACVGHALALECSIYCRQRHLPYNLQKFGDHFDLHDEQINIALTAGLRRSSSITVRSR